ncbi:uncharacterized protein LOC131737009 [Acipenser ruthenus]|uniref:uncharacterized protein LOC131737009 n=1 Tax=Acipenser ruthenus TaxID=7906 RepID=UPI002741FA9D|nr:uncharacterized protein LOC131737009 [Acipenser ruthenus]
MASRGCKHPADAFCYVCGQFIKTRAKKYSVEASAKMCEAYKAYFGMPVGDQDKPWAPHFTCEHCKKTLEGSSSGTCWMKVQVADQRKRHQPFSSFFTRQDGLCFCHNVTSLFEAIGIACNQNEWRLFIDSSSRSLKAVLLHNGNKYPSLPLAHSVHLKEDYNSIKTLLDALKYDEYGWEVIGDFKIVAFLIGLQGGFTKFPCYLCLWDSRDTKAHYHRRDWPQRTEFSVGRNNVKWEPRKVLMPPLHIKLGLIKQFVRALDKESAAFKYLQDFFPKLSEAKVKAGVFVGPQIKKILECNEFPKKLTSKEKVAWNSFVAVVRGFLGNHKAENYPTAPSCGVLATKFPAAKVMQGKVVS